MAAVGLYEFQHWMPGEDPTFYVPTSAELTADQRRQLLQAGFRPGEPFMLTNDGKMVKPRSRKFALKGINSGISIRKDSLVLVEESPGKFSLEFYYLVSVDVALEIHFFAKDASRGKLIR